MFTASDDKKRNNTSDKGNSNLNLSNSLDANLTLFHNILSKNDTAQFRNFEINIGPTAKCCLVFIGSMVNVTIINDNILKPLMLSNIDESIEIGALPDYLLNKIITTHEASKSTDIDKLIGSILYGDCILLIDGISEGLIIGSKGWQTRQVNPPLTEGVVRGPREGFTESIQINMSLIVRRIKKPELKFEFMEIGTISKTKIAICYIEGLANPKILDELKKRLNNIKLDGVLDSGYIEELIKDNPLSSFKTVGSTERPDTLSGKLLEGRIAILCDGSPFVLTVPFIFQEYFQASEDYYNSFIYGSINRLIRVLGFFLSTSIPALYVALVTFHQEMLPTPLYLSIVGAKEGVPFPTVIEALGMLFVFEIIREAGTRIPSPIGSAVSIVGALVLGDAAVTAKVISAPIVIVTSLTGISSFLLPKMLGPLILFRTMFLLLASILGIYGYMFGIIFMFIHLVSIESFGVPYMTNIISFNKEEIQDSSFRAPWWYMYYKPVFISYKNKKSPGKGGVRQ